MWVVAVLVALAVPAILVLTGFRVLATDAFVEWELGRDGFPRDPYGLDTAQRTALAKLGLRSIEPGSEGIVLLERATLPDGSPAFGERELTHMRDVRSLFGAALRAQLVAALAIAVLAVPVILLGFDGFFVRFHEIFFSGDSWQFANSDTLIRIYPEQFWVDVSRITAGLAVTQAILLAALSWWWLRTARRSGA